MSLHWWVNTKAKKRLVKLAQAPTRLTVQTATRYVTQMQPAD